MFVAMEAGGQGASPETGLGLDDQQRFGRQAASAADHFRGPARKVLYISQRHFMPKYLRLMVKDDAFAAPRTQALHAGLPERA
mmetsp:Transcript_23730/g.32073  ORF Transcript_23730/g.32073 Transcript_23730/m.32073 type:complete len:83 (-) Transcript_23730:73-321(-)